MKKWTELLIALSLVMTGLVFFSNRNLDVQYAKMERATIDSPIHQTQNPNVQRFQVSVMDYSPSGIDSAVNALISKQSQGIKQSQRTRLACEKSTELLGETLKELKEKDKKLGDQETARLASEKTKLDLTRNINWAMVLGALLACGAKLISAFTIVDSRKKLFDGIASIVPVVQAAIVLYLNY